MESDAQSGSVNMRKRGQVVAEDGDPAIYDSAGGGMQGSHNSESPAAVEARTLKEKQKDAGCCMRFLRSPVFKALMFALVVVTPVFGLLIALPVLLEKRKCTDQLCVMCHYCVGLFLAVQFMYNFAMTQWTDPGGCKKIRPTYEALGQFELLLSSAGPCGERKRLLGNGTELPETRGKGEEEDSEPTILYAPNFCELCQHWKPPRSHHCTFCKRCVLRMDHHCPFTGNCVGANNHGHFLLMYFFASVGLIYVLTLCLLVIVSDHGGVFNGIWKRTGLFGPGLGGVVTAFTHAVLVATGPTVAMQTVLSSIALVAVLCFGIPAFWLACQGSTIIENSFPMKEYVQIKPAVYCPLGPGFYRLRWHQNLGQLLGPRWFLRLLLPIRGAVDPMLGVSPRPSEDGVQALRKRIDQVAREGERLEVRSVRDLGINPGPPSRDSGAIV